MFLRPATHLSESDQVALKDGTGSQMDSSPPVRNSGMAWSIFAIYHSGIQAVSGRTWTF